MMANGFNLNLRVRNQVSYPFQLNCRSLQETKREFIHKFGPSCSKRRMRRRSKKDIFGHQKFTEFQKNKEMTRAILMRIVCVTGGKNMESISCKDTIITWFSSEASTKVSIVCSLRYLSQLTSMSDSTAISPFLSQNSVIPPLKKSEKCLRLHFFQFLKAWA